MITVVDTEETNVLPEQVGRVQAISSDLELKIVQVKSPILG